MIETIKYHHTEIGYCVVNFEIKTDEGEAQYCLLNGTEWHRCGQDWEPSHIVRPLWRRVELPPESNCDLTQAARETILEGREADDALIYKHSTSTYGSVHEICALDGDKYKSELIHAIRCEKEG